MRVLAALITMLPVHAALAADYDFPAKQGEASVLQIEGSGDIEAIEPLIRDFQDIEPGLRITYTDRLTNELFSSLESQCEAEKVTADFVFSSSADHMVKLVNDGCAQSHSSAETRGLPSHAIWRDEVFGFTFEPAVIVYNRDRVPSSDVPRTRDALVELLRTKPASYAGRVGTYDIARSGIGYLFAFFDAQQSSAFGRLLEGLGRAEARLYCCTGELLDDIASGRLLIGYNLLGSYAYARQKAGAPIGVVLPRDYTLVLSRAGFIPRRAANPQAAKRFLDYLLSVRGQQTAAQRAFFFARGQPLPDGVEAYDSDLQSGVYRPIVIGPSLLAVTDEQNRARMLREWSDTFPDRPQAQ
jgi:iron(III) transport system substrate-binding protein